MTIAPDQLVDPAASDLHVGPYIERHIEAYAELHIRLYTDNDTSEVTFDRQAWSELCSLRFVDGAHNVVTMGPRVVGKTFLATALAHAAVRRRYSTSSAATACCAGCGPAASTTPTTPGGASCCASTC